MAVAAWYQSQAQQILMDPIGFACGLTGCAPTGRRESYSQPPGACKARSEGEGCAVLACLQTELIRCLALLEKLFGWLHLCMLDNKEGKHDAAFVRY